MYVILVEMLRGQRTCGGFPVVFSFSWSAHCLLFH